MINLPIDLRKSLGGICRLFPHKILKKNVSGSGNAIKYLFALDNDIIIETVFLTGGGKTAVCVSTQAGCRMGCKFCASTAGGLERSLTAGEICSQVYAVSKDNRVKVNNIVMMGSGEPLDNYEASLKFISLIGEESGFNIGQRHITLSTCGLVRGIDKLAEERLQVTLAVSLHAPDDGLRAKLMPSAAANPLGKLMEACSRYRVVTGRRVTFEYALIDGINDSENQARSLAELLRGTDSHVNLIPVNEVTDEFKKSRRTAQFLRILSERGINATVRKSLGGDVDAACGQLRNNHSRCL
jgi:23S rRNA (adenine2503-C2)-methyltransferase